MAEKILPARTRLSYMDFLRSFAILYIVAVRHLDDYAESIYQSELNDVITYSFLGLFMFISGYLLSMNNPINNRDDLLKFISKRFFRIYPLYVIALILFMLCSLMSFKSVLMHLTLLNILLNQSVVTLWFVSIICIFYIFYPIVAYRYSSPKTAIIFILFCSFFVPVYAKFDLFDKRLLLYFPFFLLGIVSLKHNLIERFFTKKKIVICSILVFVIFFKLHLEQSKFREIFFVLFMVSAIPSLLIVGKFFSKIINKSVLKIFTYASFSMYLFHRVIFYLAAAHH